MSNNNQNQNLGNPQPAPQQQNVAPQPQQNVQNQQPQGQQQQQQQQNQPVQQVQFQNPPVIRLKNLSKWAMTGLDLNDAGFSKLHSKESSYSEERVKYDLQPDKFEVYKNELIEKIHRMHAVDCFVGLDDAGADRFLPKEYTLLTQDNVEDMRDVTWPDVLPNFVDQAGADAFTDRQIKTSCIGSYIHASLSEAAKKQLRAYRDKFIVKDQVDNEYFDGPSYFYLIAELVDPDNSHMIENVRRQLRSLNVKDYGFSIIKMLAEFKTLMQKIDKLGGRYDVEDQFLDFWDCLKTMKEKEFSRYVRQEKDNYRKLGRGNRPTLDDYIRDMSKKEVAMKEDGEWNTMSPEESMIMALVNTLEGVDNSSNDKANKKKKKKKKKNNESKKDDDKKDDDDEEKQKKYDAKIPSWKLDAPGPSDPKSKVVDGKTYYFCKKCRKGKACGHFIKKPIITITISLKGKNKSKSKNDDKKSEVTFSTDTKAHDGGPTVQVSKSLLKNAKTYLAQYQDFRQGGSQDEG